MAGANAWMVADQGKQWGPLGDAEIQDQFAAGMISCQALLWRQGIDEWQPILSVFPSFSGPISPPPLPLPVLPSPLSRGIPSPDASARRNGPSYSKFALTGCLGCGVILVVILIVSLFAASDRSAGTRSQAQTSPATTYPSVPLPSRPNPPSTTANSNPVPDDTGKTASLGQPFVLGNFKYTITAREAVQSIGGQFHSTAPEQGAMFVVVSYTIENMASATATAMSADFELLDARGRKFRTSSQGQTALVMAGQSKSFILDELQPGIAKSMKQVFEVPSDSVKIPGLKLLVPQKGLLGTGKVTVPLN